MEMTVRSENEMVHIRMCDSATVTVLLTPEAAETLAVQLMYSAQEVREKIGTAANSTHLQETTDE